MLRDETEFINNAIGIDPSGCGCLDCIVGNSIPEDRTWEIDALVREHLESGRGIINRVGGMFIAYRSVDGSYSLEHRSTDPNADFEVIGCAHDVSTSTGMVVREDSDTEDYTDEATIHLGNEEGMRAAIHLMFSDAVTLVNMSEWVLIVWRDSCGATGFTRVDATEKSSVSIIPER